MKLQSERICSLVAAVLAVGAVATAGLAWLAEQHDAQALTAQSQALSKVSEQLSESRARVSSLEGRATGQPDWTSIASTVEPSVFTISTADFLGSGWVVHADSTGSELITNLHVVDEAFSSGNVIVEVRGADATIKGTIVRVDRADDLAVIHVAARLKPLPTSPIRPALGTAVMSVGSPLGLDGTVSIGIVSSWRSIEGSDYLQFSAQISPGNSGGPVVDRYGRVVGISTAKFVGDGAEGLAFAIPVQTVCASLATCDVGDAS